MKNKILKYFKDNVFVIKRHEMKKFLPLFLIGNLITFNVVMLKLLKGALIITKAGANSIPDAKMTVFVLAAIMMFSFSKLFDHFNSRMVFAIFIGLFCLCFLVFLLFFIDADNYIPSIVFYILSDLWRSVVYGAAMWVFFNDVCTIGEAKRFYLVIIGSQMGSVVASLLPRFFGYMFPKEYFLHIALLLVILSCILAIFTLFYSKDQFKKREIENEKAEIIEEKKEGKGDIFQGIKLIFSRYYIFLILLVTLAYNFVMPITEYIWMKNLESYFTNKEDLFLYNSDYTFITTVVTMFLAMFVSLGLMEKFQLTVSLALFPMIFAGSTFFYFFLMPTPLGGVLQWIFIKSGKYAISDSSTQILYIPCEPSEKHKAKAVIDIIGARGGSFLGSLFNKLVLTVIGGFGTIAGFSYPIIALVCLLWFLASIKLGQMFHKMAKNKDGSLA